jgi:TonB family protein
MRSPPASAAKHASRPLPAAPPPRTQAAIDTRVPTASAAPSPPQAALQPAPQAANDSMLLAQLRSNIDAAVQRAAAMPEAARRQHRQGRARVGFEYIDGAVKAVQIVQSSDSHLLDDAAVAAVRRAQYPMPPTAMRGRVLALLVWIDFRLSTTPG